MGEILYDDDIISIGNDQEQALAFSHFGMRESK